MFGLGLFIGVCFGAVAGIIYATYGWKKVERKYEHLIHTMEDYEKTLRIKNKRLETELCRNIRG